VMETWLWTTLLLCSYGFFKELRPSEPFLTEYLLGPQQNLTETQVYYDIYPVWTYSYLGLLVVVFLLTDFLRYKSVIVFEGFGYVITWSLLLWARGVPAMQFMEFTYGIATSTEVAYYTYIYAKVSKEYYQRVTSYTRAALLTGRFVSGILAQLLVSYSVLDYHSLNYLSLSSVSVALILACFLPRVAHSIYFHRDEIENTSEEHSLTETEHEKCGSQASSKLLKVSQWLWTDFKDAYSNTYLLKWSIWWAFATCGNFQVGNYIQPLWESIAPMAETENLYNGAVEATQTALSALSAFAVGYLSLNWVVFGEMTLAVISLIDGGLLLIMGFTDNIWVAYVNYVLFRVSYQVLITIASYQVARELPCRELWIGVWNQYVHSIISAVNFLTMIVIEIFEIHPNSQFVIYGGYFGALGIFFLVLSTYTFMKLGWTGMKSLGIWEPRAPSEEVQEAPVGTTESV
ncbi:unnamed protein product, partial [Meganyctiphanes norvegica]